MSHVHIRKTSFPVIFERVEHTPRSLKLLEPAGSSVVGIVQQEVRRVPSFVLSDVKS